MAQWALFVYLYSLITTDLISDWQYMSTGTWWICVAFESTCCHFQAMQAQDTEISGEFCFVVWVFLSAHYTANNGNERRHDRESMLCLDVSLVCSGLVIYLQCKAVCISFRRSEQMMMCKMWGWLNKGSHAQLWHKFETKPHESFPNPKYILSLNLPKHQ